MPRIDDAIAAFEKFEADAANGKFATFEEFRARRAAIDAEYLAAMAEMVIAATKEHLAQSRS